jgi:hypothetical protein
VNVIATTTDKRRQEVRDLLASFRMKRTMNQKTVVNSSQHSSQIESPSLEIDNATIIAEENNTQSEEIVQLVADEIPPTNTEIPTEESNNFQPQILQIPELTDEQITHLASALSRQIFDRIVAESFESYCTDFLKTYVLQNLKRMQQLSKNEVLK